MPNLSDAAMALLFRCSEDALYWLTRDSEGLWDRNDLPGESLLLLHEMEVAGNGLDPGNDEDIALFLRELRRRARRAGRVQRNAVRPDQAGGDAEWRPGTPHWDRFVADDGAHPFHLLEAADSPTPEAPVFDPYHSEVAAWAWLARHFERRTRDIAAFLLISPSWCRQRRRRARHAVNIQWPLSCRRLPDEEHERSIQPWRRFKLPPRSAPSYLSQCPLDFWQCPQQPERGQLWLL